MSDFFTIKDAQADLTIAAINAAILLAPYEADPALTLESPDDGGLEVPEEYLSVGHFEKKAGVTFTTDIDSKDIEAYGESDPIRTIISRRKTSFDFSMYQNGRANLELFWAADFSAVTPSDFGGVVLESPATPGNIFYRAIVLGLDNRNNRDIWPYWLLPKVQLSKVDNQQLNDDGVIEYHPTLTAFKDDTLLYSVAQGFAGPGWRDLVALAGFAPAPTALTATPSTATVTVASGATHTAQLVLAADNGINYTPDAKFVSLDPTKASVSADGVITGVAAGSTSVTATVKPAGGTPLTATVAVTVTA